MVAEVPSPRLPPPPPYMAAWLSGLLRQPPPPPGRRRPRSARASRCAEGMAVGRAGEGRRRSAPSDPEVEVGAGCAARRQADLPLGQAQLRPGASTSPPSPARSQPACRRRALSALGQVQRKGRHVQLAGCELQAPGRWARALTDWRDVEVEAARVIWSGVGRRRVSAGRGRPRLPGSAQAPGTPCWPARLVPEPLWRPPQRPSPIQDATLP